MNITIFEDSINDRNNLIKYLTSFLEECEIKYLITIAKEPNDIYRNIDNIDLIFLDIEVSEFNGIDVGLKIRDLNKNVQIVITSAYQKYLIDGYKVHATRYFLKPLKKNEFQIEMKNVVSDYIGYYQNFFDPKISHDKIYYRDIIYIEYINRKSCLYKIDGQSSSCAYSLIYWIEHLIEQPFVQTHRGFIVNMNAISAYNTKEITLINGSIIPLSRKYRYSFENKYLDFIHSKV